MNILFGVVYTLVMVAVVALARGWYFYTMYGLIEVILSLLVVWSAWTSGESFFFAFVASSAIIASMATITIRRLDEKTKARLRVRAAHHGRSMEEEAREILRSALRASSPTPENLAETIQTRFARFGGVELPVVNRDRLRDIPAFEE